MYSTHINSKSYLSHKVGVSICNSVLLKDAINLDLDREYKTVLVIFFSYQPLSRAFAFSDTTSNYC